VRVALLNLEPSATDCVVRDIVKRIDTEVMLLNDMLAKMHSSIALIKEPSKADLYSAYLSYLWYPIQASVHHSRLSRPTPTLAFGIPQLLECARALSRWPSSG
jgi:hypothetical protein